MCRPGGLAKSWPLVGARRALLGEAATTGRVIAASHLRTAGTVERIAGGFRLYPFPAKA